MNEFANVTVSTLCFPTDGAGAVSAIRGLASTGATTSYTNNTATDATAWDLTTVVAGDYAFTADGYWGIVQSKATNQITVDRWRRPGRPGSGLTWVPATGGAATVHSTSHIAGSTIISIKKINLLKGGGGETFALTDAKGTNLTNMVYTATAAVVAPAPIADFGDGILVFQPFGMKASGTTNQWQVVYDATGPTR